jgi:hypothetical protein
MGQKKSDGDDRSREKLHLVGYTGAENQLNKRNINQQLSVALLFFQEK